MQRETGTFTVKSGLAEMLKGGVIMDVTTAEQAKIAEDAGACSVMALERVPADIRKEGGVARMADPTKIEEIKAAVTIPVMAKARIGHFVEAQVLQSLGVDYIDESEVLTPADEEFHIDKWAFTVPFVCGCRNLGEALRRIAEGAAMIRTKGEAGTGNVVEAVRHERALLAGIAECTQLRPEQYVTKAKELGAPVELVRMVAEQGRLPVVNFSAGGIATPGRRGADDAARRRRRVRRLGHLQVRGPGDDGPRDRRGDDALPGPRRGREGQSRASATRCRASRSARSRRACRTAAGKRDEGRRARAAGRLPRARDGLRGARGDPGRGPHAGSISPRSTASRSPAASRRRSASSPGRTTWSSRCASAPRRACRSSARAPA